MPRTSFVLLSCVGCISGATQLRRRGLETPPHLKRSFTFIMTYLIAFLAILVIGIAYFLFSHKDERSWDTPSRPIAPTPKRTDTQQQAIDLVTQFPPNCKVRVMPEDLPGRVEGLQFMETEVRLRVCVPGDLWTLLPKSVERIDEKEVTHG